MIKQYKPKDQQEWLEINSRSIGGSKAAAILGLDPYKTPYDVWAEMTGRKERPDPFSWNFIRGQWLEEGIAGMFSTLSRSEMPNPDTGYKIIKASADPVVYYHPEYEFIAGTPDRRIITPERLVNAGFPKRMVLEIKSTRVIYHPEDIPFSWFIQPMLYMGLMGLKMAVICWFELSADELKYRELEFDQAAYDSIINAIVNFHDNYIVKDIAPKAIRGSDVVQKFPQHWADKYIQASDEILDMYSRLIEIRDKVNPLIAEKEELHDKLKCLIGPHEGIMYDTSKLFSYKTDKRGTRVFRMIEMQ